MGVVAREKYINSIVEFKTVSDRITTMNLGTEGVLLNVISLYALQVGCELEEKEEFCNEVKAVVQKRIVMGRESSDHVGEGNNEHVIGRYGEGERILEGHLVIDFAKRMEMAVSNAYFKKREGLKVTYMSGNRGEEEFMNVEKDKRKKAEGQRSRKSRCTRDRQREGKEGHEKDVSL
ncbi:uncharacterized protein LOC134778539 [Penaeus indicus]|uniref:uncharacterized protein LOC134778539 n=1 Tax=Penaeus indicus TaxID=29960 RepID=UPI00300C0EB7